MKKLALAISIVAKAFQDKVDKGGQPYVLHCLHVMHHTIGDEDVKCAAVMHDLFEDTDYTAETLLELGFSAKTIQLIDVLTHRSGVEYMDYIRKISHFPEAVEIKKRDLEHNSQITRLKGLRKKDIERLEKYNRAYVYLSN